MRWFAYTLSPWFAHSLVSRTASGDGTGFIKPATHADVKTAKYPESLCPPSVLPPVGRRDPPPPRTLLPVPGSYGLRRQTLLALPSFASSPRSESLCRLLPAPAASGFFPTLSLQIFPQMLGPLPRRSHRVLVPVSSPRSSAFPNPLWVGFPFRSAKATFRGLVFEDADIPLCSGLGVGVVSQIAPTAASLPTGQPRLLRPGISCFVTSARSGYAIRPIPVIDGKRTSTFQDLQPCRLLQCLDFSIPINERHLKMAGPPLALTVTEWVIHSNRGRPHSSLGP